MIGLRCSIRLFSLFCFALCVLRLLFRLFFFIVVVVLCHADREEADLSLVFARACGVCLVSIFLAWRVLVYCA